MDSYSSVIKNIRNMTDQKYSILDCKRAIDETGGDISAAIKYLEDYIKPDIVITPPDIVLNNSVDILPLNDICPDDIPIVIGKAFDKIKNLEKKNKAATAAANSAKNNAKSAKSKSTALGKKGVAIEALQEAGLDTANALVDVVKAQELSFELHRQTAETTKYLFALGVGNLANTRSVMRNLETKLNGASKGKLSKLARDECISVIRQLKAQEDMMLKQENTDTILKKHNNKLEEQCEISEQFQKDLEKQSVAYELQNSETQRLLKQIEEQSQSFNTFKNVFSKKIIIAYIIGGIGAFTGIIGTLLALLI